MRIEVKKNKPINEDERGKIYKLVSDICLKELIIIKRKKSAVSGNHYHKGLTKSKNPEKLIVINGSLKIYLKDLKTREEKQIVVRESDEVKIYPNIYHAFEALEDNTIFIELKKEKDDYTDVFKLK